MSTLNITEHDNISQDKLGNPTYCLNAEYLAQQAVSFTSSSVQSSAFNASAKIVRLVSDANCSVVFGTNPTAVTATQVKLIANIPECFALPPTHGSTNAFKVAVIQS